MGQGFVLWFTGLSGSGKSTLTALVAAELRRRGIHVETLDGDEIRRNLSKGLGFSREDRDENIRRIGFVAKLVARSGACAIAAAISPYRDVRAEVRRSCGRFVEVYTECPVPVLAERDPKGLYKKALAGEIRNFTGVDDPYEAPETPEIHLSTDTESPEESLGKILTRLEELGLIPEWGRTRRNAGPVPAVHLPAPHGHHLVDGRAGPEAAGLRSRAAALPAVTLDAPTLASAIAIVTGAYSPLDGFMTQKDRVRVGREQRLEAGLPWSLPVTLVIPDGLEAEARRDGLLALRRGEDVVAIVDVEDCSRDVPGGPCHVGGRVRWLVDEPPGSPPRVREALVARGLERVVAFVTGSIPLVAHEYLARAALETADGVLVLLTEQGDERVSLDVRLRAWRAVVSRYVARERAMVEPFAGGPPTAPGPIAVTHAAIVARNLGASALVFLDPGRITTADVDAAVGSFLPGELGMSLSVAGELVVSPLVGTATLRSSPDGGEKVTEAAALDGLRQRRDTAAVRPEVAALVLAEIDRG